jgi:glycine hydroxymethyltransferase
VTTRGFGEPEMKEVGRLISQVIHDVKSEATIHAVRKGVAELTGRYPLYAWKQ